MITVIYHANCTDGAMARYCIERALGLLGLEHESLPGQHGETLPDVAGKDVIMVDFSVSPSVLESIAQTANSVYILDHHISAKKDYDEWNNALPKNTKVVFDMKRSGAYLAHMFVGDIRKYLEFINKRFTNEEIAHLDKYYDPTLNLYYIVIRVQDRDLWKFDYSDTKEIHRLLSSLGFSDKTKHITAKNLLDRCVADYKDFKELFIGGLEKARIELNVIEELCQNYAQKHQLIYMDNQVIPVVNCPANLASRVGEILSKDYAYSITYVNSTDVSFVSLRSNVLTGVDVSLVAKKFGGGGHKNAAGFKASVISFHEMIRAARRIYKLKTESKG